ncbi:MAG: hypothetical protein ACRD2L_12855, partial [Terriglobia bacterium]
VIPDSDHIARYCKTFTAPDGEIQATAFMLREGEESLSVNWLEELKCPDRSSEVRALQILYRKKMSRVGTGARIAILNVGVVRTKVQRESPDGRLLRVLHDPEEPDDPSHSGIYELRPDNELVAELIAQVVLEKHPARA